jgi:hypothetical protein
LTKIERLFPIVSDGCGPGGFDPQGDAQHDPNRKLNPKKWGPNPKKLEIQSFGQWFDLENQRPKYIRVGHRWKETDMTV